MSLFTVELEPQFNFTYAMIEADTPEEAMKKAEETVEWDMEYPYRMMALNAYPTDTHEIPLVMVQDILESVVEAEK